MDPQPQQDTAVAQPPPLFDMSKACLLYTSYPAATLVDGVQQSSTIILDNVTNQAIFNFTDQFLESATGADDRLTLAIPPIGAVSYTHLP